MRQFLSQLAILEPNLGTSPTLLFTTVMETVTELTLAVGFHWPITNHWIGGNKFSGAHY